MDPVVVVGGGISGVACARVVADAGLDVTLLDRGRRLGGRMAVRTVDGRAVDTGASYFTVSDDGFRAVVDAWRGRGLARPWTDTFDVIDDDHAARSGGSGRGEPKQGSQRWASPTGLRSLVEDLATGLTTEQQSVDAVTRDEGTGALQVAGRLASVVVLAMPDPQAARLLDGTFASSSELVGGTFASSSELVGGYEPTLALVAAWPERIWGAGEPAFEGAFVNGDPAITWIADDGRRRGDGAAVLVAHSTADLARAHLADPSGAGPAMFSALRGILGIDPPPAFTHVHRWSFAHPAGTRERTHHLGADGIGLCGDSWAAKPRVEAAWLSGTELGHAVVDRLGAPVAVPEG